MKFSVDRKYLATGGEDGVINIWKVRSVTQREWRETHDHRIFEDTPIRQFNGHKVENSWLHDWVVAYRGFRLVQERIPPLGLPGLHRSSLAHQQRQLFVCLQAQVVDPSKCHLGTWSPRLISIRRKSAIFSPAAWTRSCVSGPFRKDAWSSGSRRHRSSLPLPFVPEVCSLVVCPIGRLCAAGLSDGQVIFYYADGLRYFTQVSTLFILNRRQNVEIAMERTKRVVRSPELRFSRRMTHSACW